jgi:retron-type reverse transcriptase
MIIYYYDRQKDNQIAAIDVILPLNWENTKSHSIVNLVSLIDWETLKLSLSSPIPGK